MATNGLTPAARIYVDDFPGTDGERLRAAKAAAYGEDGMAAVIAFSPRRDYAVVFLWAVLPGVLILLFWLDAIFGWVPLTKSGGFPEFIMAFSLTLLVALITITTAPDVIK